MMWTRTNSSDIFLRGGGGGGGAVGKELINDLWFPFPDSPLNVSASSPPSISLGGGVGCEGGRTKDRDSMTFLFHQKSDQLEGVDVFPTTPALKSQ